MIGSEINWTLGIVPPQAVAFAATLVDTTDMKASTKLAIVEVNLLVNFLARITVVPFYMDLPGCL